MNKRTDIFPQFTLRFKANQEVSLSDFKSSLITLTLVDNETHTYDVKLEQSNWSGLFNTKSGNNTWLTEVVNANLKGVKNTGNMFSYCINLKSVSLFNTGDVADMQYMFEHCSSLNSVLLFDTSHVLNMNSMFTGCKSLTTLPLFDTSNVDTMNKMFSICTSLVSVPLFNTKYVHDMSFMFAECTSLVEVPLFDTSNVMDMQYMFGRCYAVKSGALALYQQASTQAKLPSSHEGTFSECGINTTSGLAELQQIPTSWGGLMEESESNRSPVSENKSETKNTGDNQEEVSIPVNDGNDQVYIGPGA